jgi:NADPH:quinone reductase-like Zn-dependent oxidoreductase
MMKAVRYSQFGGPEVLQIVDLPDPHAGPGQIRVAVHAAGVNPTDWKLRKGLMGGELPQTTGREVAGVVDEVGEGGTDVAVGDRVFGFSDDGAGAAELALLSHYAPIPRRLASPRPPVCRSPSRRPRAAWTRSASGPGARCSSTAPPAGSAAPPSSSPWRAARA